MIVVPENYEAIGSCFLSIDLVKTGDCEINSITVLIWDRVLQLGIVGLLIGYASDFAASMGFHHLLVRNVEDVVESILRVIGWKDCRCKGSRSDESVGLCGGSWAAEQEREEGEIGESQENGQAEENGQFEVGEASGSSVGFANVDQDVVIRHQARRQMTLDELIEAAAKQNWDLVIGARTEKRSFDELEPAAADKTAPTKRTKVEFNNSDDNISGYVHHLQEQVKHKTAIKAESTLSKSARLFPASEKPTSQFPKSPPRPIFKFPSRPIDEGLSLAKDVNKIYRPRTSRGRGDPRNARMQRERAVWAARCSASAGTQTAWEQSSLLRKTAISRRSPREPIEPSPGIRQRSRTLEMRPHPSSAQTVFDKSAFPASNVGPGESVDFTIDPTGHDRGMLDRSSVRQHLEAKLTLEVQALVEKVQQDDRDRIGIQGMRNHHVQHPTEAFLIPDDANETAVGNRNTSKSSSTNRNTTGKENVLSVIKSRGLKNDEANSDLRQREGLTAHDVQNSATATSRPGPADFYRPRY